MAYSYNSFPKLCLVIFVIIHSQLATAQLGVGIEDYPIISRHETNGRISFCFIGKNIEFQDILESLRKLAKIDPDTKIGLFLPTGENMLISDLFREIHQIHDTGLTNLVIRTGWELAPNTGEVAILEVRVLPFAYWNDSDDLIEITESVPAGPPESPKTP